MFLAELCFEIKELEISRRPTVPAAGTTTSRMSGSRLTKVGNIYIQVEDNNWRTLWEQFEGTIHSNRTLSTTNEFHY